MKKAKILTPVVTSSIILLLMSLTVSTSVYSQTRNLYIEGDGDQMGVIHSTDANTPGFEMIRGDNATETDWRILNLNGVFRIESATNNFLTPGTSQI